jgi:uncharacterized protein (DUF433 family)
MDEISEGVTADSDIMHGKPVLQGTRIPVEVVLNTLADGVSIEEVCEEFDLEKDQVFAAVGYAAERVSDEEYRGLEA